MLFKNNTRVKKIRTKRMSIQIMRVKNEYKLCKYKKYN